MRLQFKSLLILMFWLNLGISQAPYLHNFSNEFNTIDRLDIKNKSNGAIHTSIRNQPVDFICTQLEMSLDSFGDISDGDYSNIEFILNDNDFWAKRTMKSIYANNISETEKRGIFNTFYKNSSTFYSVDADDFYMKINPVIYFDYGKDIKNDAGIFQNTRGFEVSGLVGNKIYYYTSLFETQESFLEHINKKINRDHAIPGQGLYKTYNSSVVNNLSGYDFLNSKAYFGFKLIKEINAELGHGNFFIGNGIRSLLLSDYGQNYFYLKFNTKIWKLHYQNIFAELGAQSPNSIPGDEIVPKKYMASHYLSFQPTKNIELGLFESVIFNRQNGFELQYLNPIIIYRTVEHFIGSPDNVLAGINWKYNFLHRFSLYGQLLLDEFNFSILKENTSWWGNKYGFQSGIKYIDIFGIDQLDGQIEFNYVRPFTYSHGDSISNYSNYNQALAHPLGANFKELLFVLKYHPDKKIFFQLELLKSIYGDDPLNEDISYGGNILKSYLLRPKNSEGNYIDYGYSVGNGIKNKISQVKLNLSYMIYHNYFIDFDVIYRNENSEDDSRDFNELYIGGGIRVNIKRNNLDY